MKNLRFKGMGAIALSLAFFQFSPTCHGQALDLLYEGGATGNFSSTGDWLDGNNPMFGTVVDSLTFGATPAGGAIINNDLDPADNGGVGVVAALGSLPDGTGTGTRDDSASFHFLDDAGDFTITGFPIEITSPNNAQFSAVRIEPTAGTLQTIDTDIVFRRNAAARIITLNGGTLVLNGDISFGPAGGGSWFFGDTNLDSPAQVEFNGVGTLTALGGTGQGSSAWASGANVLFDGLTRQQALRVNAGDLQRGTLEGGNGSHLIFGNSQALGRDHIGAWETNDLDYVFMASTRVERFNDGYADNNTFSVTAGVDLSEYGIATVFGSNWNFRSEFDTTIGFIHQFWAREDANATNSNFPNSLNSATPGARDIPPNGSVTVDGAGVLSVAEFGGIFPTQYDGAERFDLRLPGTNGTNGQMIINGKLYNSWNSPAAQASFGTTATGGIEPGPKVGVGDANVSLFAKPGQLVGADGSLVNGSIRISFGTLTLNGDSGSTWRGSEILATEGCTIVVGDDNALGDANSLVSIQDGSILDTGTSTIAQELVDVDGTIRGNGTLNNADNLSITGGVQPGDETPTAADALTFDFSAASAASSVTLEAGSSADFVLDAGTTSSTVVVSGSAGGTTVAVNGNVDFTDLTGGSLTGGTYVLIDGNGNTTVTLGAGVTTTGLAAFPGSSIAVVGNDLVLNLVAGGTSTGDFNGDGNVDCDDLDFYVGNIGEPATGALAQLDLNNDNVVNRDDAELHITTLVQTTNGQVGTFLGDLNCDGTVNVLGDAFTLIGNLLETVTNYSDGDVNFDGTVNVLGDAFILIGNLGDTNAS